MANDENIIPFPDELIMNKIYLIREKQVMLDADLAELYAVETKQLKRAVRRNIRSRRAVENRPEKPAGTIYFF